ncbi:MAG: urea ABC transporter ATP-binding subunit UrtE [Thermostichales cyanobacterium DRC_bins_46]
MAVVTVSNFNVYYGESHILRDVSLAVPAGEVVCLLGRNGVGKTTLLKSMMGLLRPRRGQMLFEGQDLTLASPDRRARAGIGYVPQGREIFPKLTVAENLEVGREASEGRQKTIPEEVFELFPVLKTMLQRRGGDLSGGQQQQLAIARALVAKPKLLLLDEPTEGIQPSIILEIEEAIAKIKQQTGAAVLLVEQYFQFAQRLADAYYVMDRGSIVLQGRKADMDEKLVRSYLSV